MSKHRQSVMTIDELAEYLKVTKSTLYRLAQSGKVPGQKAGKHRRFHRGGIDQGRGERGEGSPPSTKTAAIE